MTVSHAFLHGIYLILDEWWSKEVSLVDVLSVAAACGVGLFQYRNKTGSMHECYQQALLLREASTRFKVKLIINDRCDLAKAVDADGVHIGQKDLPLILARKIMGPGKIIGVSTHQIEEVEAATREHADYVGFGPIFPSTTKSDHEPVVGIDRLAHVRSRTSLPIFAIGGITLDSMGSILQVGADGVALASAILGSSGVEHSLKEFIKHFQSQS